MKMKNVFQIVSVIMVLLMLSGCSLLPKEDEYQISPVVVNNQTITYKTAIVEQGDISKTETVTCTYKPVKTQSYAFDLTGESYDAVYVSAGEYVEKGQLLAQLNVASISSQIASCLHSINSTSLSLQQTKELRDIKYEHQKELIEAATEAEKAFLQSAQSVYDSYSATISSLTNDLTVLQMKYSELLSQLGERQIYADFSGNVTTALVRSSMDKSVQGETVVTIADTSTSMFTANTQYYSYFNVGDVHSMTVNGELCSVKVVDPVEYGFEKSEVSSDGKAVVYFEMEDAISNLDENGSGRIELVLEKSEKSLYVVSDAIINTSEGSSVYYFDESKVMRMKSVKTGIVSGMYTEILEGVKAGEELILG